MALAIGVFRLFSGPLQQVINAKEENKNNLKYILSALTLVIPSDFLVCTLFGLIVFDWVSRDS